MKSSCHGSILDLVVWNTSPARVPSTGTRGRSARSVDELGLQPGGRKKTGLRPKESTHNLHAVTCLGRMNVSGGMNHLTLRWGRSSLRHYASVTSRVLGCKKWGRGSVSGGCSMRMQWLAVVSLDHGKVRRGNMSTHSGSWKRQGDRWSSRACRRNAALPSPVGGQEDRLQTSGH